MNHLSSLIRLVFLPIVLIACNSTVEKPQEDKLQELQKKVKKTLLKAFTLKNSLQIVSSSRKPKKRRFLKS